MLKNCCDDFGWVESTSLLSSSSDFYLLPSTSGSYISRLILFLSFGPQVYLQQMVDKDEAPGILECREVCTTLRANHGIPKIGMSFDSEDDAYSFYNSYGSFKGFGIRKNWVNKNKDGAVTTRNFTCYKEGQRHVKKQNVDVKHPRKEVRTNCMARMTISLQPDGKYSITYFDDRHNHELVTPSEVQFLRSQRRIDFAQSVEVVAKKPEGTYEFTSQQVGGEENVGFLHSNSKNYLSSKRKRSMNKGEAGSLLHYFQKKQFDNPSFIYSIQLDVDDQITNIFWADAKMLDDYHQFGDVICFDTSYRINRDCRPFAQFVGVNNHKETIIFGAAFLYDETIESFTWVFNAFIEAMSGEKPKTILTNQDEAMDKAIASVLPETKHRLCVRHLYQNALKHLNHVFKSKPSFAKEFSRCIYDYEEEETFLDSWELMLDKYNLRGNDWLERTFEERKNWAMVYDRHTFCADMKSTQLSMSSNSKLKKYLNAQLDVSRFFDHFERFLDDIRHKELRSNFNMTQPIMKVNSILLLHARNIYTSKIFDWFQEEFEKTMNLVINLCEKHDSLTIYKISIYEVLKEYTVTWDSTKNQVTCSCKKFEFVGILCSHILKVLERRDIKRIPTQYILKRWTKDATVGRVEKSAEDAVTKVEDPKLATLKRYKELCRNAINLSGVAAGSEEDFLFLMKYLEEAREKLSKNIKGQSTIHSNVVEEGNASKKDDTSLQKVKGLKQKEDGICSEPQNMSCTENPPKKTRCESNQSTQLPVITSFPSNPQICPLPWNSSIQGEYIVGGSSTLTNTYLPPNMLGSNHFGDSNAMQNIVVSKEMVCD